MNDNDLFTIDGRSGEGGGQILRTSLSLSALTGRPFRLTHIRANRKKPGLRPQHLTAVRAAAALCAADLSGAELNSARLEFRPQAAPQGGAYRFDVAEAASGGSAGSVTLIFQTILWPLLFADAPSQITLRGGTHVPFSPPFHYLAHVAVPAFARMGGGISLELEAWGWYPAGGGAFSAQITPLTVPLQAQTWTTPPPTERVEGVAAVTNLPSHIPHRMARRADNLLRQEGHRPHIEAIRERGRGPGAGMVLWAPGAGFTSLGRKGLPAEQVAETAVAEFRHFVDNKAAVDRYLADQLLLPLALARGGSQFTTDKLTTHTQTNAALLRRWLDVPIDIDGDIDQPAAVAVSGLSFWRET